MNKTYRRAPVGELGGDVGVVALERTSRGSRQDVVEDTVQIAGRVGGKPPRSRYIYREEYRPRRRTIQLRVQDHVMSIPQPNVGSFALGKPFSCPCSSPFKTTSSPFFLANVLL